jgi:hypothetical protein
MAGKPPPPNASLEDTATLPLDNIHPWDEEAEEALVKLETPTTVDESLTMDATARKFLVEMGVVAEPSDEDVAHLYVLLQALRTYSIKDQTHKGLWRYFGAIDSAHQARAKATRTYNISIQLLRNPDSFRAGHKDPMDDAIDLINYAAFFIRNVSEGRYGGD